MLTRLTVRNFKRLASIDVELGQTVVLVGPNNSGKTSALQALALWQAGVRAWLEKWGDQPAQKRPGVTLNRKDLIAVAVPNASLLWRDLHVRSGERQADGKSKTRNVFIEICVEGITDGEAWQCGFEFDYANQEAFYCRPLRLDANGSERMPLPRTALLKDVRVAFLPAMSGLASIEPKLELGRINVLIGEGQTAQVLRNLCYRLCESAPDAWQALCQDIQRMFGVELTAPEFNELRGEVTMGYRQRSHDGKIIALDLSSAGRGLQQTLLLLAFLRANPNTTILVDEPDAHLEILRQRQIYDLISGVGRQQAGQIIAASHSEVVLNEAAERDKVVAFVGKPHVIDRPDQVMKALSNIGFDQYLLAEERGWVLYVEGATDLKMLAEFASLVGHPALEHLQEAFVHYVGHNQPSPARSHFHGLREAKPDLRGIAIFDRISSTLQNAGGLEERMWQQRELENYFCRESALLAWARGRPPSHPDLFWEAESGARVEAMTQAIERVAAAAKTFDKPPIWSADSKASDDVLGPVLKNYAEILGLPKQLADKSKFAEIIGFLTPDDVDREVRDMLDAIVRVAEAAPPQEAAAPA